MSVGYASEMYADTLQHIGEPEPIGPEPSWVLERKVPGTDFFDAAGPYPIMVSSDWDGLLASVKTVRSRWVTLTLVSDPLGSYSRSDLEVCFPDYCVPFKTHFVVSLEEWDSGHVHKSHRRNISKAKSAVTVTRLGQPWNREGDWIELYHTLKLRHSIAGHADFPVASLRSILRHPDIVVFRAHNHGDTLGMMLWMTQSDRAYYHLAAYSEEGYRCGASFLLVDHSIRHFQSNTHFRSLNLGGGAGFSVSDDDGLTRFKRGFSTHTRVAFICGRVLDGEIYHRLCQQTGTARKPFFPAYRYPGSR